MKRNIRQKRPMTRREFLDFMVKGVAISGAVPYLPILDQAVAQSSQYKYFVGVMAHTLGMMFPERSMNIHNGFFDGYGNWKFAGPGTLGGLAAIRNNIFVPRGLTFRVSGGESVGHFLAQGGFLTGYPSKSATTVDRLVGGASAGATAPASVKSIDWLIAQSKGLSPLAMGYRNRPNFNGAEAPHFFKAISWQSSTGPLFPDYESRALHQKLKEQLQCSLYQSANQANAAEQVAELRNQIKLTEALEKSYANHLRVNASYSEAYDVYIQDFRRQKATFQEQVSQLQSDIDAFNSVKNRIAPVCDLTEPSYNLETPSANNETYYLNKVKELNGLTARCLKAGVTNAVTMSIVLETNHGREHWLADGDVGREGRSRDDIIANGEGIKRYMDRVNEGLVSLVTELTNQGIFQDTLILVCGEQNDGNTHTAKEAPVLVIDGKNANWNGQNLGDPNLTASTPLESRPYASLLVDILNKFGVPNAQFGSRYNIRGRGVGGIF